MEFNYIFDFDGTIFNPYEGIRNALKRSISDLNIEVDDKSLSIILDRIGPPMRIMIEGIIPEKYSDKFISLFRKHYDDFYCLEGYVYPFALKFIKKLRKNKSTLSMTILSNKPLKPLIKICSKYKIESYFDNIIGIDHKEFTGSSKKEKLKNYINKLKLDSRNCIFFGDRKDDFDSANLNNCIFCGNIGKNLSLDQFNFLSKII